MGMDIDLGTILAHIRLDAEQLEATADTSVNKLQAVGEQGLATQKKISPASAALNQVGVASRTAAQGANDAAQGFAALGASADLTGNVRLDKLQGKIISLTASIDTQRQTVNRAAAELDTMADRYIAVEQRGGWSGEIDLAKVFPTQAAGLDAEISKLSQLKSQLQITQQEYANVAAKAEQSSQRQAASASQASAGQNTLNQKLDNTRVATANTRTGLDTVAMSIRGVSSAAGGAVGNIGYLATEIAFAKRSLDAGVSSATAFAVVLSVGLMGAVTIITSVINIFKDAEEQRQKAFDEGIQNLKKYSDELNTLQNNFKILQDQKSTTDELTTARNNLTNTFPELIVGYTAEGDAILADSKTLQNYIEQLKEKNRLSRETILLNSNAVESYTSEANRLAYLKSQLVDTQAALEQAKENQKALESGTYTGQEQVDTFKPQIDALSIAEDSLSVKIHEVEKNMSDGLSDLESRTEAYIANNLRIQDSTSGLIKGYDDLNKEQQTVANNFILNATDDYISALNKVGDGSMTAEEAQKRLENSVQKLNELISDSSAVNKYYDELTKSQEAAKAAAELETAIKSQMSAINDLGSAYSSLAQGRNLELSQLYSLAQTYPQIASYLAQTGDLTLNNGAILAATFEQEKQIFIAEQQASVAKLETKRAETQAIVDNCKIQIQALQAAAVAGGAMSTADMAYNSRLASEKGKELADINSQIDKANALIKAAESQSVQSYVPKFSSGSSRNEALANELKDLDQKKKMNELTSQEEIDWLERIQNKYRMSADEQRDIQYRLYSAKKQLEEDAEKAASAALQEQYKQMENQKNLGELTSRQELDWLLKLRNQYRINADERVELEVKIYNLKKSLHEADVSALNTLGDAVTEALKNQYKQQEDAEKKRIQDSIDSWDKWEKDTVASIQGQIDALDTLEKQQESADKRAEYEKKRQALELQAAYEKDDYQRKQYQLQMTELDKAEQDRQAQEARDAQRKALEDQMKAAQNTAQSQKDSLKDQLDAVDKNYEQLTSEMSLRAQAEQAIMSKSQNDLIALIKSYAPDYNITGQSLGEQLVSGFQSKVQDIEGYVQGVMDRISNYQNTMAAVANKAADDFWASRAAYDQQVASSAAPPVTNNINIQFMQTVDSPIETKRQIEEMGTQLARMIQSGG